MKIIRFLSSIVCIGVIITSVGCSSQKSNIGQTEKLTVVISTDSPRYSDIEGLTKKANVVIEGTVLNSEVKELNDIITTNSQDEKLNPGGSIPSTQKVYTVYNVKVINAYKGTAKPGDIIQVKQLGGDYNNTTYILKDGIKIENNKKYIMFLETYKNIPASLLNPIQSCYTHEEIGTESTFISANSKNDLKLTNTHISKMKLDNINK